MMERGFAPEICELAVVGAGPAGMAAATLAAQLGVDTVLVDERPAPGGAMYGGLASGREEQSATFGRDYAHGASLIEAFRAAKLTYVDRARVCGLSGSEDAFELCVATQGESRVVRARRIVLAPGALERPLPIVGGALPGVGYAGATMRELKNSLRFPEGRVVLAGCGPLLYAAASALRRAGAEVVAMLDTLNVRHFVRALPHALGFMRSPYYATGAKLLQEVNDNIPIYHDVIELAALGNDKLASVRFTSNRRTVTLIADALLLHQGIVPDIRLADRLGCAIGWDDQLAGWTVSVDAWGASSVAGAFVAGDGAAIAGARAAEHHGRICALAAACALGHIDSAARDGEAQAHRRALADAMRGRRFLDRVYRPPQRFRLPQGQEIVCRCEGVTAEQVIAAAKEGSPGPEAVKALLRCGLGPCHGRECSLTVTELIAQAQGSDAGRVGRFDTRHPAPPMPIAEPAASVGARRRRASRRAHAARRSAGLADRAAVRSILAAWRAPHFPTSSSSRSPRARCSTCPRATGSSSSRASTLTSATRSSTRTRSWRTAPPSAWPRSCCT